MAIYLDASALVKLVVAEPESGALRRFLRRHPVRVASALVRVEVPRAVRAQGGAATRRAAQVLRGIDLVPVDDAILDHAGALDPAVMRSLDAIHLASARELGDDLEALVTYDGRMTGAAGLLGLETKAPR